MAEQFSNAFNSNDRGADASDRGTTSSIDSSSLLEDFSSLRKGASGASASAALEREGVLPQFTIEDSDSKVPPPSPAPERSTRENPPPSGKPGGTGGAELPPPAEKPNSSEQRPPSNDNVNEKINRDLSQSEAEKNAASENRGTSGAGADSESSGRQGAGHDDERTRLLKGIPGAAEASEALKTRFR